MSPLKKIARSNFGIRLRSWEYWPFGIIQFPIFIYWFWLSLRSRSLLFFTASNPGILMGGMFGESKYEIIKNIPKSYVPKTVLIQVPTSVEEVLQVLKGGEFSLPVIFKPELGERGFMVKKINSEKDIREYLAKISVNFLAQDFVDLPLEFGVFYMRHPDQEEGKVISIVIKEMLSVTGDGRSTLQQLILNNDRAKLQWEKLKEAYRERLHVVVSADEKIELVSIGNHALGTTFINGSHLINEKLSLAFDRIAKQIPGFYFGRFDIRCRSLEDLYQGKIQIMELNGCGAEPAHIYHPGFSMFKAICILFRHWHHIFEIARANRKRGVKYLTLKEGYQHYKRFKTATK